MYTFKQAPCAPEAMRMFDSASSAELRSLSCVDFFFLLRFSWIGSTMKSRLDSNLVSPWIGPVSKGKKHCIGWWDAVQSGASKFFHLGADSLPAPPLFVFGYFAICVELKGAKIPDWASFHHNLNKKSDATIDSTLIHPHPLQAAAAASCRNLCHKIVFPDVLQR